ncbi:MAG TPA: hypothetical protein VLM44_10445 [Lutibacter sp.]|nr:hypothetical protein [Lutibacter sp.]
MKTGLLVVISIFFSLQFQLKAQENIVVLHPLVGSTIDKTEMEKYALFNEHRNENITYFIINTNKEKTYLLGLSAEKIVFNTEIGSDYLAMQTENIEKIHQGNSSFSKTNSTSFSMHKTDFNTSETIKMNLVIMTPEMRKSIKQSINQEKSLNLSKEHKSNLKKGFRN